MYKPGAYKQQFTISPMLLGEEKNIDLKSMVPDFGPGSSTPCNGLGP